MFLPAVIRLSEQVGSYGLVTRGYARVFDSPFRQSDRFYAAESDAQSTHRRVWACRTAEEESPDETDDSETARRLTVARIHADAAGNDHENLNDKYVVFANTGESALELSGWTVADETDHTYRFPAGFTLAAGERVTLYTGSGSDSATELHWIACQIISLVGWFHRELDESAD